MKDNAAEFDTLQAAMMRYAICLVLVFTTDPRFHTRWPGRESFVYRSAGGIPSRDFPYDGMGIMVARIFKRPQNIRPPMDTGTEQASCHLPDSTAFIMDKHFRGDREHLVFSGAARALFAPIAGQGMHRPGSNHLILVL